jgi:hypothetical protein
MPMTALIAEATRKSAVVWVQVEDDPQPHPVWQVWHAERMYVVTGGLEQPLTRGERAVVAVRSKERQGNLLVRWVASVAAVAPGTPQWEEVVPLLHAARLNAPDGEEQPARWARESTVLCFTPTGEMLPV